MKTVLLFFITILLSYNIKGQEIGIIPSPSGYEGTYNGLAGNPIEFNGKLYFQYRANSGNLQLAEFDGNQFVMYANPTNFQNSTLGYQGNPIVYNGNLYLQFKDISGNYFLAKLTASGINIISNPSGYSYGYQGYPIIMNNYLYMMYMSNSGDKTLMRFDGTNFTPITHSTYGTSVEYFGSPMVVNNKLYLRYKRNDLYYQIGICNGTNLEMSSHPANYNTIDKGYIDGGIELNGNFYCRFRKNDGSYHLVKHDGTDLTVLDPVEGGNYMINVPPIKYNNAIYMRYTNSSYNHTLYKYDGTSFTSFPSDAGFNGSDKGYLGEPIVSGNYLYLRYKANNNNNVLMKFDGASLTPFNNYAPYDSVNCGYSNPIPFAKGDTLLFRMVSNTNNFLFGYYKGTGSNLTIFSQPAIANGSNAGYVGDPIIYKGDIYLRYAGNDQTNYLAKVEGSNINIISNPNGYIGNGIGYNGMPVIFNNTLYMRYYSSTDYNFDLAKLLDCSHTENEIFVNECYTYTSPSGIQYNTSGTYTDIIPNTSGCDSVITIHLTIDTINTEVTNQGNTLSATLNGATYQWGTCNPDFQIISGEIYQIYTANESGNYAVIISKNGCTDTSDCINLVYTENELMKRDTENINFYKNRYEGIIELTLNESDVVEISIIDIQGRIIFHNNTLANKGKNIIVLDSEQLRHLNGIAILSVKGKRTIMNTKITAINN